MEYKANHRVKNNKNKTVEVNRICEDNTLVRDVQSEFEYWFKNRRNKILSVVGAKQVGKTTEILKFAYKHYKNVIHIDLFNQNQLSKFEMILDVEPIIFGIDDYCLDSNNNEYDNSSNTVIIIDEIQESPKIYNSMRSLQSDLECDIIVTNSFLGKILNSKYFKPSGNTYEVEMLPLSFKEFCRAFKYEDKLMGIDSYERAVCNELNGLYRTYLHIGGYPEVAYSYLKKHDIKECDEKLKDIILRFIEESAQHFNNDEWNIIFKSLYNNILCKEPISKSEVNNAISWLNYSKIIGYCDLCNQIDMVIDRRFYFMDCGIARYLTQFAYLEESNVNKILAKNFIYIELYRVYIEHGGELISGRRPCSIYGDSRLDFMITFKNGVKYEMYLTERDTDKIYLTKGETIKSIPIYTVGCRFPYK